MRSIKDMVKNNKKVKFEFYREGYLYYKTECNYIFPVPINDTAGATFNCEDRAIMFMRYIRKHVENEMMEESNNDIFTSSD